MRFKERSCLSDISASTSADAEAAAKYPDPAKIILKVAKVATANNTPSV